MDKELKALLEQFNALQGEMHATLSTQGEEIRAHGETTRGTATQIEQITANLSEVGQEIRALQERVKEAENAMGRPGGNEQPRASVGQRFTDSAEYSAIRNTTLTRTDAVAMGRFFEPRNATFDTAAGGGVAEAQRFAQIITAPERAMRLRDVMDVQTTTSNAIEYIQETGFTNSAATRAEGAAAVESGITLELKSESVRSIAHYLPATREILNDASQLQAYINGRLLYGMKLKEEQQILYGNGTSPNLRGLMTNAAVQKYSWSAGKVGDTKLDAIRRAITKARVAEYPVNAVVLHPTDWEEIETLKGSDGKYLWVQVSVGGTMEVWRVPVVETTAVNAGSSLLGSFGMAATLWDREEGFIRVSDSHADFFTSGKIAIMAEERVALTTFRPEAFVNVTFNNAPSAG